MDTKGFIFCDFYELYYRRLGASLFTPKKSNDLAGLSLILTEDSAEIVPKVNFKKRFR